MERCNYKQWLKWTWTQGNAVPGPKIFKAQRSGAQELAFRGPQEVRENVRVNGPPGIVTGCFGRSKALLA